MKFIKFIKKYKIKKIEVVRAKSETKTEIWNEGKGVGVCVDRKTKEKFKFELNCSFRVNSKKGDKGQVKIIEK